MQTTMKSAKRVLSFLLIFALVVGTAVGFAPSINDSEVYAATNTITVYVTFAKEGALFKDKTAAVSAARALESGNVLTITAPLADYGMAICE